LRSGQASTTSVQVIVAPTATVTAGDRRPRSARTGTRAGSITAIVAGRRGAAAALATAAADGADAVRGDNAWRIESDHAAGTATTGASGIRRSRGLRRLATFATFAASFNGSIDLNGSACDQEHRASTVRTTSRGALSVLTSATAAEGRRSRCEGGTRGARTWTTTCAAGATLAHEATASPATSVGGRADLHIWTVSRVVPRAEGFCGAAVAANIDIGIDGRGERVNRDQDEWLRSDRVQCGIDRDIGSGDDAVTRRT
jgi:hypothetical protein